MFATIIFALLLTIILTFFIYIRWSLNYWTRKNVPNIKPNWQSVKKEKVLYERIGKAYNTFKSNGDDYFGIYIFSRPILTLIKPDLIKTILTKDFNYFNDHGLYYNEKDDPLAAHLFSISGEKWKKLRTKLTPTFTSGKMKMMFQTLITCSDPLINRIDEYANFNESIDIKEVLACFTTDVIGTCAFGLEFNSFKDSDAEFRKYGRKLFKLSLWNTLKRGFLLMFPHIGKIFHMKTVPEDVTKFFMGAVKETVDYRIQNNYKRNDFLQLLLELKNSNSDNDKPMTIEEIAAQCFVFFAAGFETSSTTMTFCLYELAQHADIQEKVREEIKAVLEQHNGSLTYEATTDMKYMGQVIDETLRKYPPASSLIRKCTHDYEMPETNLNIKKGTPILIPAYALHHDPEYFPEPHKFDPERFSDINKNSRHQYVYLPFGEGPRICIGLRFGIMQTKVGLAVLLKNYRFSLSNKTPKHLTLDPNSFVTTSKETIYLNAERLN